MFFIGNLMIALAASVKAAATGVRELPRYARWHHRWAAR